MAESFVYNRISINSLNVAEIPILLTESINFCAFLFEHVIKKVHGGEVGYLVDKSPEHEVFDNCFDIPLKNDRQHNLLGGDDYTEE